MLLLQIPEGNVRKSDMLPDGWSDGGGVYSLMYQRIEQSDSATYLLKVISVEGMLLVHLLVSTSQCITYPGYNMMNWTNSVSKVVSTKV